MLINPRYWAIIAVAPGISPKTRKLDVLGKNSDIQRLWLTPNASTMVVTSSIVMANVDASTCVYGLFVVSVMSACKKVGAPNVLVSNAMDMNVAKLGRETSTLAGNVIVVCTSGLGEVGAGVVADMIESVCGAIVIMVSTSESGAVRETVLMCVIASVGKGSWVGMGIGRDTTTIVIVGVISAVDISCYGCYLSYSSRLCR